MAIDYVCRYPGTFAALPRHSGINLSIQLDGIQRRFGGCAMNIAYTLKLLGDEPTPFAAAGRDYALAASQDGVPEAPAATQARGETGTESYAAHLRAMGMDTSGIHVSDAPYSAHGFVFTDREQNQFTGFFGGESDVDFKARLRRFVAEREFDYAILAPDVPAKMTAAAHVMRERRVPFLADPGQNITDFADADAVALVRASTALIVNQYEYATIRKRAGADLHRIDPIVVTLAERGARWISKRHGSGAERAVEADVVDPTGCGDAFRGGFVHALLRGSSLRDAVRGGAVTASVALRATGTQMHRCDDFAARYSAAWNDSPAWLGEGAGGRPAWR